MGRSTKRGAAWVAGALLALPLLAWGCSSVSNDDPSEGSCGPRPDAGECPDTDWMCAHGEWVYLGDGPCGACPPAMPNSGDPCDSLGISCPYESQQTECGPPGGQVTFQCTDSGWAQLGQRCTLPAECPAQKPDNGTDCSDWPNAVTCLYSVETACGPTAVYASCVPSGEPSLAWFSELPEQVCPCHELTTAEACGASQCRWLEPGCGDDPPVQAGCYDFADCVPNNCDAGAECVTVSTDPCWDTLCNACDAPAAVCLASTDGG